MKGLDEKGQNKFEIINGLKQQIGKKLKWGNLFLDLNQKYVNLVFN